MSPLFIFSWKTGDRFWSSLSLLLISLVHSSVAHYFWHVAMLQKKLPLLLWGPLFVGPLFGRTCWTCLNPPLLLVNSRLQLEHNSLSLRSSLAFYNLVPFTRPEIDKWTFHISAPTVWNSLPGSLQLSNRVASFNESFKLYFNCTFNGAIFAHESNGIIYGVI